MLTPPDPAAGMKTIREQWQSFARAVGQSPNARTVQRRELRRAFYAGFYSMLTTAQAIGALAVSDEEGAALLVALWAEAEAFNRDVRAGRA
jgi:hypothetical protein